MKKPSTWRTLWQEEDWNFRRPELGLGLAPWHVPPVQQLPWSQHYNQPHNGDAEHCTLSIMINPHDAIFWIVLHHPNNNDRMKVVLCLLYCDTLLTEYMSSTTTDRTFCGFLLILCSPTSWTISSSSSLFPSGIRHDLLEYRAAWGSVWHGAHMRYRSHPCAALTAGSRAGTAPLTGNCPWTESWKIRIGRCSNQRASNLGLWKMDTLKHCEISKGCLEYISLVVKVLSCSDQNTFCFVLKLSILKTWVFKCCQNLGYVLSQF